MVDSRASVILHPTRTAERSPCRWVRCRQHALRELRCACHVQRNVPERQRLPWASGGCFWSYVHARERYLVFSYPTAPTACIIDRSWSPINPPSLPRDAWQCPVQPPLHVYALALGPDPQSYVLGWGGRRAFGGYQSPAGCSHRRQQWRSVSHQKYCVKSRLNNPI